MCDYEALPSPEDGAWHAPYGSGPCVLRRVRTTHRFIMGYRGSHAIALPLTGGRTAAPACILRVFRTKRSNLPSLGLRLLPRLRGGRLCCAPPKELTVWVASPRAPPLTMARWHTGDHRQGRRPALAMPPHGPAMASSAYPPRSGFATRNDICAICQTTLRLPNPLSWRCFRCVGAVQSTYYPHASCVTLRPSVRRLMRRLKTPFGWRGWGRERHGLARSAWHEKIVCTGCGSCPSANDISQGLDYGLPL